METPEDLFGLVLAGGRSRRMGRDLATLIYRGQLQVDRMVRMLRRRCQKVMVSVREEQDNPTTDRAPLVVDRFGEIGPFGGILSAFYHHRDRSFFVASCSMPFISLELINELLAARDPSFMATLATRADGSVVPTLGIYENAHKHLLLAEAKAGQRDLEAIVAKYPIKRVVVSDLAQLDEVVTSDAYYEAQKRIIGV